MNVTFGKLFLVLHYFAHVVYGFTRNTSSRPVVVNVGAILDFNTTIGRVAKVAIEQAVKDVNSNASILHGTKLVVITKDSGCSRFAGAVQALEFMESGKVVAIIGPQSSKIAHLTAHVTNEYRVPALSFGATDPSLSYIQFPFFVRTTRSDLYQMTAIADIINHYGWKHVISVFIDDEHGRNGIAALDTALVEMNCQISHKLRISPSPGVTRDDITDMLVQVALSDSRVIVLHAYDDVGFKVLSVAHHLGMLNKGYAWIATDWLTSVLDSSSSSSPLPSETMDTLQGVLALRQHIPDSDRKRAFISRWNKLTGGAIGLNTYGFYAYDTVWLVAHAIDSFLNQGGNTSFSNNYKLSPDEAYLAFFGGKPHFDGGMHLLKNILQSDLAGLTGLLKFNPDRSLVLPSYDIVNVVGTRLRMIGYWSNSSHLSAVAPEVLHSPPNQKLLDVLWPGDTLSKPRGWVFPNNGEQLRIGVPIPVSFKEFVSKVRGSDAFKGYCIDVFKAAVSLLPYAVPYQFIAYGDGQETPSYTELVKLVSTGFFDAAIGDIAITTNRSKIVDFTQPFAVSGLEVVAPFTKINTGAWAFLQPLSLPVWGFIAFCLLLVGVVLWILERRVNDEFSGSPLTQLRTILWFCLCSIFGTHRENTRSTLGRIVLIIWLFVVLILIENYTASLSSRLLVQHLSSPIKGIEDLKMSDDPIGYPVGSFVEQYLIEEIGIPKFRLVPLASPEEYAIALQSGPKRGGVAAVVDEKPYIESFLSVQCKFRIVGRSIKNGGWGFAFPRDSPLIVDISSAILTMTENGDLQRIHDEWFTSNTCKFESTEIASDRLHLDSFWGLYLIIGIACVLALVIHFSKIMPRSRRAARSQSRSGASSEGSLRPRKLQQLMHSVYKSGNHSERESKRRKLERSL